MRTGLSFALNYASPEIILAQENGARTLAVDPAADVWALGVTAYELLSGGRTFAPGTPTSEIRNMISGRLPLPWEVLLSPCIVPCCLPCIVPDKRRLFTRSHHGCHFL